MSPHSPIGIFDSGLGGLVIAKKIRNSLPNEDLIYFGDTAHLPYGDKSTPTIQSYSVKIAEVLLQRKCKIILIACNSASSAAFELIQEYCGKRTKVFDVINPMIQFIKTEISNQHIGMIGTKHTVESLSYDNQIKKLQTNVQFSSLATPLLVPMIEENFINNKISDDIIGQYLAHPNLENIDVLILGCTHYPIIKKQIAAWYKKRGKSIKILDSGAIVSRAIQAYLQTSQLENTQPKEDQFLVSDYTLDFEKATQIFFGEKIKLTPFTFLE